MEHIERALELARRQRGISLALPLHAADAGDPDLRADRAVRRPERLAMNRARHAERRVVLGTEQSPAASAYRMLRTQVLQRVRAHAAQTIGIVSAVAGEGKTLTSVNLAMSLAAEPNQGVSLVDLDLRRPVMAEILGVTPPRGLDDWIHGSGPATDVIYEIEGLERLQFVPTLRPVPTSADTLATQRVRELLRHLRDDQEQQIVIVDQSPALLGADALTLAPLLDGYILVISENRTRRDDVKRVLELLGRDRCIGTILNGSASSEMRAY